jgi:hypothetical protein
LPSMFFPTRTSAIYSGADLHTIAWPSLPARTTTTRSGQSRRLICPNDDSMSRCDKRLLHREILILPMSQLGHERRSRHVSNMSAYRVNPEVLASRDNVLFQTTAPMCNAHRIITSVRAQAATFMLRKPQIPATDMLLLFPHQSRGDVPPIMQEIRAAGIATLDGIASALNARAVRSARGGTCHRPQCGTCSPVRLKPRSGGAFLAPKG